MQQNIQETNLRVYGYNDLHENALPHELHKALESGGVLQVGLNQVAPLSW